MRNKGLSYPKTYATVDSITIVAHKVGSLFEHRFTPAEWRSVEWRGFKRRYYRIRSEYVVTTESGEGLSLDSRTLAHTGSHPAFRLKGRKKSMEVGARIKLFKHPKDHPARWRYKFVGE